MDLSHLVFARRLMRRVLGSPAVHFVAVGALIFALSPAPPVPDLTAPAQPVVIQKFRVEQARRDLESMVGRTLSAEEEKQALQVVVDQEVLYQYALRLGLDKDPVVERRLAQIAAFVSENPHEIGASHLAAAAVDLGLREGDLVVRRILIDGARRLIRAAVLVHEPKEELLTKYLQDHPDEFTVEGEMRISHVALSHNPNRRRSKEEIQALLDRLRSEGVSPDEAARFGDPCVIGSSLPLISEREIDRRFGYGFAAELARLPAGSWQGPLRSRYGEHIVFVHEQQKPRTARLDEVRKEVRARVQQQLSDQWLSARLSELRSELEIVLPQGV